MDKCVILNYRILTIVCMSITVGLYVYVYILHSIYVYVLHMGMYELV